MILYKLYIILYFTGSCPGDSGAPLTFSINGVKKLVGLVTFGYNPDEYCSVIYPTYFVNVAKNKDQIMTHVKNQFKQQFSTEFDSYGKFKPYIITNLNITVLRDKYLNY